MDLRLIGEVHGHPGASLRSCGFAVHLLCQGHIDDCRRVSYHLSQMRFAVSPKNASFTVGCNPPHFDAIVSFDLAGRLIGAYFSDTGGAGEASNYRRGYDNRMIRLIKDASLHNRLVEQLDESQRDALLARCFEIVSDALASDELDEPARGLLARAAACGPEVLERDRQRFIDIYGDVPILPPDQYRSLVLQVTRGCPFNECEFCCFYRGCEFRVNSAEQFDAHIGAVRDFFGRSLLLRQSVFLGDANAILVPTETLLQRMACVRDRFDVAPADLPAEQKAAWRHQHPGGLVGFYGFLDGLTGTRKTAEDYEALAAAGLRRVYIGAESGCDLILNQLKKPCRREQVVETVNLCKASGVAVGLIFLAGLGDQDAALAGRHVAESCALVNELPLGERDIVYLSPFVAGGRPDGRVAATAFEQTERLRAGFRFRGPKPRVVNYDIRGFIY